MTALDGIGVLDVTEGYAGYTGKLFADLGADVVKVERPGGDPARSVPPVSGGAGQASAFYGFLNTSKRGVVLDPGNEHDRRTLDRLVERADVLVEDGLDDYGLTVEGIRDRCPGLVVVSTTGFGRSGPRSGYESVDLVEAAMGGMVYQSGYPDRPPTRPPVSACSYLGATHAAIGALAALRARDRTGGQHVDVSRQEAVAANIESAQLEYSFNGSLVERTGSKHNVGHPGGMIYPVEDGYVVAAVGGTTVEGPLGGKDASMWPGFCRAIGREDLLSDERFNALPDDPMPGSVKRLRNAAEFDEIVREELAGWTKEEFYHGTQEAGVSTAPVSTPADLLGNPQLEHRGFLDETELPGGGTVRMPSAPYVFSETPAESTRAPELDEHADEVTERDAGTSAPGWPADVGTGDVDGPLEGVRVLDFTMVWAGPLSSRILADLGADVLKVESRQYTDLVRGLFPYYEGEQGKPEYGEDRSGYFQTVSRNKRSLAVDLGAEEGVDLVREIVADGGVDVVIESFSPGTMERLGLSYDDLAAANDDLIMCSLSGYGGEGPESGYRAYGPSLEPQSGISHLNGFPGDDPVRTGISFTDPVAGLHGAFAVLAALRHRDRTGEGQFVDLSQLEAGATVVHPAITRYDLTGEGMDRIGNRDERGRIVQGVYPCADTGVDPEEWIAIAIRDRDDWEGIAAVAGNAEWVDDGRFATQPDRLEHHDALDDVLAGWTAGWERYDLMEALQANGVPAGVVQSTEDLLERDEHLESRGFWEPMWHPIMNEHPYPTPLPRLSETPGGIERYGPMLGQHSREILYEVLDVDGDRVQELEETNVLQ